MARSTFQNVGNADIRSVVRIIALTDPRQLTW